MKNFCYLLFLFTAFPIFSADWEPYPLNQKSYYQSDDQLGTIFSFTADSAVIPIWIDTIQNPPYDRIYYFNSKPFRNDNICDSAIEAGERKYYKNKYFSDGMNSLNNVYFKDNYVYHHFEKNRDSNFIFYHLAKLNEQWETIINRSAQIFDTIRIKCIDAGTDDIFGKEDSIKVFLITINQDSPKYNNLNNQRIILSKNYGFLEFIHPKYLLKSHGSDFRLKLIGFEINNDSYGFTPFNLKSSLKLNVGDLILWSYEEYSYPHFFKEYYLDSIARVNRTDAFFEYEYLRKGYDGKVYLLGYYSIRINYKDFEQMLKGPTEQFYLMKGSKIDDIDYEKFSAIFTSWFSKIKYKDNIYEGFSIVTRTNLDTNNCEIYFLIDFSASYHFNSLFGLCRINYSSLGSFEYSVIGARINGEIIGFLEFPLSVNNDLNKPDAVLLPNPAKDLLTIRGFDCSGNNYRIINILGETIKAGIIENNSIIVSELNSGIYFLQIYDGLKVQIMKFAKW